MPREGCRHQLPGEPFVARWIEREADVSTPPIRLRIVDATVCIEFQHVRGAFPIDPDIATTEAGALQPDKETCRFIPQALCQQWVWYWKRGQALILDPLQIRMLETLPFREAILCRCVCDGVVRVLRILRHQHRTLDAIDVFLDQRCAMARHDLAGLNPQSCRTMDL